MPLTFEKISHLAHTLRGYIYRDATPVAWRVSDALPYGTPQPDSADPAWRTLRPGDRWGRKLTWGWLTSQVRIPDQFAGKAAALHIEFAVQHDDPGGALFSAPEALVTVTGLDVLPQAVNRMHHEVLLSESVEPGLALGVAMQAFAGVSQPGDHQVLLRISNLVWIDRDLEALYWDSSVLLDLIAVLPEAAPERVLFLNALDDAFRLIDWLNPPDEAFQSSVRVARDLLHRRVFTFQTPGDGVPRPHIHALGHAHIDVAWLWPLAVTRGKAVRTFTTALALMEQYPDYTFTQSQPHLYKMVSEDDPALFERVKARIADGRWNATGGTWVEPDTNVPSGEALVRQFLYGMRYFERVLGARPEVLWLPDVFGYSAALPQIMKLSGIRYFFTSKLSWNLYTRYPYDTFWWEGLDGTRILTHLATAPEVAGSKSALHRATYNAKLTPLEVLETWDEYQQKNLNHHLITAYGEGDGGGGPNRDMIERRARMADLPGVPQVSHSTAESFFHALEATISAVDMPRWVGELYLQIHRGTYTSQARTKRNNRKTELLLHDAEALSSLAYLLGEPYPHAEMDAAWETVLLNQFHDILPGSSITPVYQDADRMYAEAQARAQSAAEQALDAIAEHIRYDYDMQGFAVFNTLGITQGGPVEVTLPGSGPVEIVGPSGRAKPFQWVNQSTRRALVLPETIPAYGYTAYVVRAAEHEVTLPLEYSVTGTPSLLDNDVIRAEFDERGNLIRLYDCERDRDVLAPGEQGNQLWAYVDRPHHWDAWDVEAYVQDQGWRLAPESIRVIEAGPLRATLETTYQFNRSRIVQRISLAAGARLLTFDTEVDWHERHILLRLHVPVAIRATNATYEIQFGTVERPTHFNTAWDQARHEVPAQQWVDLSESDYGVSVINDCKYGHSTQGHTVMLSLLRAPTHPDPEADQGAHRFTYAIYPHGGDWRSGVIAQAKRLNSPLMMRPVKGGGTWLPVEFGLVACKTPGVVIDTMKKAEDDDALIVRVYEAHGGRCTAALTFAAPIMLAEEVNFLEEPLDMVDSDGSLLRFTLTPYQIRSFKVTLSDLVQHQLG